MGKFQIAPISNLIENLTENITPAEVELSFGRIMLKTNMGKSLIDTGKSFIGAESSPLGKQRFLAKIHLSKKLFFYQIICSAMVSRYFLLSGLPLNRLTICDEIQNMISYLVENVRPASSNSISEEGKEKIFSIFSSFR